MKNKNECYYTGIENDAGGNNTSHIISLSLDDCINTVENKTKKDTVTIKTNDSFKNLFDEFTRSMISYIEFMPVLSGFNAVLSVEFLRDHMKEFANQSGTIVRENDSSKIYQAPIETFVDCLRIARSIESAMDIGHDIPRMLTSGIVSAYDYHLAGLIRWFMNANPNAFISMGKNVSIVEVLSSKDIESFRTQVIEDEIFSVMVDSHDQQIQWIVDKFKLEDLSKAYKKWSELMELFSRRNLFVHSGGKVNDQYISNSKKYQFSTGDVKIGDNLYADSKYFNDSVSTIIEFGVMLYQVVWRKHISGESAIADTALRDFGYELIVRGQYALAERVFAFSLTLREKREEINERMMIVNYANSVALQDRYDDALAILAKKDWSAVSDAFNVSIASIKRNETEVGEIIRRIGTSGAVTLGDYRDWPVFYHVRESEEFITAIREVFGVEYVAADKYRGNIERMIRQRVLRNTNKSSKVTKDIENVREDDGMKTLQ